MKTVPTLLLAIILSLLTTCVTYAVLTSNTPSGKPATKPNESAFDRVMRTKTLRCGYIVYPPTVIKDANSGQLSGIIYDIIEEMGKRLHIKIDWNEEANWAGYLQGLKTGRYDAVCFAGWANTLSEQTMSETVGPLFYSVIQAWVRPDDTRFDNNLSAANNENITISSIDGTIPGFIAASDFPKAKVLSLPPATDYTSNILNVANGKTDLTFVEQYMGNAFLAHNPGTLKKVISDPVKIYPNVFLVGKGEYTLQTMLQMVLNDMQNNGDVDTILSRYEQYPNSFYRVNKPYQVQK